METEIRTNEAPITLTPGAVKEVKRLQEQQELNEEFGLRVGVEGGGCAGMRYILGFDQKREGDQEYCISGIKIFVNKVHENYLHGIRVDHQDGLNSRGFIFDNPRASKTCGCGTSFSV